MFPCEAQKHDVAVSCKKAMRWLAKGCEIQNVLDRWYIGSVGDFVDWGALGLTCV